MASKKRNLIKPSQDFQRSVNLDVLSGSWLSKGLQRWFSPLEIQVKSPSALKASEPSRVSPEDVSRFNRVIRLAYGYIGERHLLGPVALWTTLRQGLVTLQMSNDEIDDVERTLFGWRDLNVAQFERYRFRYPERCPLLDVLQSLDETCQELNELQDWLLEMKGSTHTRRSDLLPALPDPDGVRPERRAAGCISFSDLLKY